MRTTPPRVSIGLAVRNGAAYLVQAIESILAQTLADFELILSDNASNDSTEDICRHYAAQDGRIRYYRNPNNIGGTNNENQTFCLARGQYFRWAAHDDILAPTLLDKCVAVLDAHPEVVLCYTETAEIDQNSDTTGIVARRKGMAGEPHQRLNELIHRDHQCEMIYGVMRSETLRQTRLLQDYTDCDRTLLCELALHGQFCEIPEPLFYRRYHPANANLDWHERMVWYRPGTQGQIAFPYWLQFFDMYRSVHRVPLPVKQKALCYLVAGRWTLGHSRRMARELAKAGYLTIHDKDWRLRRHASMHNWE
jgi:glycosyltransferase involved in cell wall biosynthesis